MFLTRLRYQPEIDFYLQKWVKGDTKTPLMLVGPEGVGKKFAIKQAVRLLFCEEQGALECKCFNCLSLERGTHTDFFHVGSNSKAIGVEEIRDVIDNVDTYPVSAPYKVFLIEGVDNMTVAAANALLKVLEEPPSVVRFLLTARSNKSVLGTIRSRVGLVRARKLPEEFIVEYLVKYGVEETKAKLYARLSEGSLGLALNYWGENVVVYRDKVLALLLAVFKEDLMEVYNLLAPMQKELGRLLLFLRLLLGDMVLVREASDSLVNVDCIDTLRDAGKYKVDFYDLLKRISNFENLSEGLTVNNEFHLLTIFLTCKRFLGVNSFDGN